jgi:hypothetical protein
MKPLAVTPKWPPDSNSMSLLQYIDWRIFLHMARQGEADSTQQGPSEAGIGAARDLCGFDGP